MVSLRGRSIWLLALRGRMRVGGAPVAEVELEPGLAVELAPGLVIHCDAVELPPTVLAVRAGGLGAHVLLGTTSFYPGPPPTLRPGVDPEAAAVFYTLHNQWRIRLSGGASTPAEAGTVLNIDSVRIEVVALPVEAAARTRTRPTLRPSLRFAVGAGHVSVSQQGTALDDLTGVPGLILAALLRARQPVAWRDLCESVWPDDRSTEASLRNRLDVGLARLRSRLRALNLTDVVVALDGAGYACLRVAPEDEIAFEGATRDR